MTLPSFYPILDTESCSRCAIAPVDAASEILAGGAKILQFRHKGFFSREIFDAMEQISNLCRQAHVPFVVNDRADLARLLNAALHLGQDDLPPSVTRNIVGTETIIGFSTHNEAQLRAAGGEPADYLALGPIFGTASKLNPDPTVGLDGLRRLRPLTSRPLVAIGGITRENARDVLDAGADSVAVIGDIFATGGNIRGRVEEWIALLK
jgi:thiamine-phosphate pyrophosphorylase